MIERHGSEYSSFDIYHTCTCTSISSTSIDINSILVLPEASELRCESFFEQPLKWVGYDRRE